MIQLTVHIKSLDMPELQNEVLKKPTCAYPPHQAIIDLRIKEDKINISYNLHIFSTCKNHTNHNKN